MIQSPIPPKRALEVAIVMFDDGLSSTAVMPTEILYCAGNLWNVLNNEAPKAVIGDTAKKLEAIMKS